jgi:hypothetical protein
VVALARLKEHFSGTVEEFTEESQAAAEAARVILLLF